MFRSVWATALVFGSFAVVEGRGPLTAGVLLPLSFLGSEFL